MKQYLRKIPGKASSKRHTLIRIMMRWFQGQWTSSVVESHTPTATCNRQPTLPHLTAWTEVHAVHLRKVVVDKPKRINVTTTVDLNTSIVLSGIEYDPRLTRTKNTDLQWLEVPERIKYKLCLTVVKCLHGIAQLYFSELWIPVAQIEGRRQMRSAARSQLVVPRTQLSTYGKRAFVCAGPSAWNYHPVQRH